MMIKEKILGKYYAARSLAQFARYFENWREVWSAYRSARPLPPLEIGRGITLYHDGGAQDDPIFLFREIFINECYTGDGFYRPRAGETVIDLGANIGSFALFLEWSARGIFVHSFEPASDTRQRLSHNIIENGLAELVTMYPHAVSDRDGSVVLKKADLAGHQSLFDSRFVAGHGEETVSCVSLDGAIAMCGGKTIDLLKVDIEGAEIEVLEGASPATWNQIRRVVVEYHDLFRPGCRERTTRVLESHSFRVNTVADVYDPRLGIIRASRNDSPSP